MRRLVRHLTPASKPPIPRRHPQVLETRSELDNLDLVAGCPLLQLHPERYQAFLQAGRPQGAGLRAAANGCWQGCCVHAWCQA